MAETVLLMTMPQNFTLSSTKAQSFESHKKSISLNLIISYFCIPLLEMEFLIPDHFVMVFILCRPKNFAAIISWTQYP